MEEMLIWKTTNKRHSYQSSIAECTFWDVLHIFRPARIFRPAFQTSPLSSTLCFVPGVRVGFSLSYGYCRCCRYRRRRRCSVHAGDIRLDILRSKTDRFLTLICVENRAHLLITNSPPPALLLPRPLKSQMQKITEQQPDQSGLRHNSKDTDSKAGT
jgi:hypothetical protein